jgi:hypothetical protein
MGWYGRQWEKTRNPFDRATVRRRAQHGAIQTNQGLCNPQQDGDGPWRIFLARHAQTAERRSPADRAQTLESARFFVDATARTRRPEISPAGL